MFRQVIAIIAMLIVLSIQTMAKDIKLPQPNSSGSISLEQSIASRRSERSYQANELSPQQLSQILWAAQGITDPEFGLRAAPSAGALYPLSIYIAKGDGLFRYISSGHKLVQLSTEDKRPSIMRASLGQAWIRQAPVSIILAANFKITQEKYGPRAYRYVCMEAGHVAENILLQAVSLGLASIAIGAFWDDVIKVTLELPDNQDPLYIISLGYLAR